MCLDGWKDIPLQTFKKILNYQNEDICFICLNVIRIAVFCSDCFQKVLTVYFITCNLTYFLGMFQTVSQEVPRIPQIMVQQESSEFDMINK